MQLELGAIVDAGRPGRSCSGLVSKEYEQKALERSEGTADPSRINSAFFPIGHNPSAA